MTHQETEQKTREKILIFVCCCKHFKIPRLKLIKKFFYEPKLSCLFVCAGLSKNFIFFPFYLINELIEIW